MPEGITGRKPREIRTHGLKLERVTAHAGELVLFSGFLWHRGCAYASHTSVRCAPRYLWLGHVRPRARPGCTVTSMW